jgi:hypothetical protein
MARKEQANEGEGNRTAARRYNREASKKAPENQDKDAAPASKREEQALRNAEERGKSRARH